MADNCADPTRTAYASAWGVWVRWCQRRGGQRVTPRRLLVCAYLAERADAGLCAATLELACSAISYHNRQGGGPDPIRHEAVPIAALDRWLHVRCTTTWLARVAATRQIRVRRRSAHASPPAWVSRLPTALAAAALARLLRWPHRWLDQGGVKAADRHNETHARSPRPSEIGLASLAAEVCDPERTPSSEA